MNQKDISLRMIRFKNGGIIPKYLIEMVGNLDWKHFRDIDFEAPDNFLFLFLSKENKIVGFWAAYANFLTSSLDVYAFAIDRRYRAHDGSNLRKVVEVSRFIRDKLGLKKCFWLAKRPEMYEKFGLRRSKWIAMED